MSKRLFILLFLLADLLTACVTTPPSTHTSAPTFTPPSQKMWTVEDAGRICFRDYNLSTQELSGIFRPKGCFSSTCTRRQEQKVDVTMDGNNRILKFVTKFVVLDIATHTPQEQQCSADCNHDGVSFKFPDVVTGTYTVTLGDRNVGSLEVPPIFKQDEGVCFGESD